MDHLLLLCWTLFFFLKKKRARERERATFLAARSCRYKLDMRAVSTPPPHVRTFQNSGKRDLRYGNIAKGFATNWQLLLRY
ncbi:hypothetical protein F5Y11DRAFT_176978 [Daldinia sp. FL1419]|nr:hypothetical protein F5Y11DRAFT_176978 [Daldinia sp. FL1419]